MIQFLCKWPSRSKAETKKISNHESSNSLAELIRKREWQQVSKRLLSSPEECSSENSAHIESDDETLLHTACRYHPTIGIIEMLLTAFPDTISKSNRQGHCPLHIAASHGVHPVILDMLIQKSPIILKKRDNDGRLPLHLACAFYTSNYMNIEDSSAISPSTAATIAIKVLVKSDESVVNVEDQLECTGLEYAITCNSNIETIRFLQKYCLRNCRRAYRRKKATDMKRRTNLTSLSRITNFITMGSKDTPDSVPIGSISTSTKLSVTTSSNPSSMNKQCGDHIKELDECTPAYD